MLAKASNHAKNWDLYLPYVLFSYRVAEHESTRDSPFKLLYGLNPKLPTTFTEPVYLRDSASLVLRFFETGSCMLSDS